MPLPPNNYTLRQRLIAIADHEAGTREEGTNSGKKVREYQAATTLGGTGWPWCAAFVCWCIWMWGKDPDVLRALKMDALAFSQWRPRTASAFGFIAWAKEKDLLTFDDGPEHTLHAGDIMVFDMSHIGLVATDLDNMISTIEGNTGSMGGREGDGVWRKTRQRSLARRFIRLLS